MVGPYKSSLVDLLVPNFPDNYHCWSLSWNKKTNILAVADQNTSISLYNPTCSYHKDILCATSPQNDYKCIKWNETNNYLAVGTKLGNLQIFDTILHKQIRSFQRKSSESVTVIDVKNDLYLIGGNDGILTIRDLRTSQNPLCTIKGLYQRSNPSITNCKWSTDENYFLAIAYGAVSQTISLYDRRQLQNRISTPILDDLELKEYVGRGIVWASDSESFYFGGKTERDKKIWKINSKQKLVEAEVEVVAPVEDLLFLPKSKILVAGFGFSLPVRETRVMFYTEDLKEIGSIPAQEMRTLFLDYGIDESKIVTASGFEKLIKIWDISEILKE